MDIKTWIERMPARLPESMLDCAMMQITCMAAEIAELRAELAKPERVPLTSKQRKKIFEYNTCSGDHGDYYDPYGILKDVEAFYGIKEKPLFVDLIAAHEGLAEELRAVDDIKETE
jgi:hypothetical protein